MLAMEYMETLEDARKEELRQGYEGYIKQTVHTQLKPLNPEQWLETKLHKEIEEAKLKAEVAKNIEAKKAIEINKQFKILMYENGFGDIISRARYFGLGKV